MEDIFHWCREGNAFQVRVWLDDTENDLNLGDDHGFSPLHWAAKEGRANIVEMLIMRGARINAANMGDDTALHLASAHGHRDIVHMLLRSKADINAVNEHGNTPLHYACFWGYQAIAEYRFLECLQPKCGYGFVKDLRIPNIKRGKNILAEGKVDTSK